MILDPFMSEGSAQPSAGSIAALFDFLIEEFDLCSDAGLAREMEKDATYISRLRRDKLPLTANLILFIHDQFGLSISDIRQRAGLSK